MTSMRVAIYARVSSDQQVEGGTVASQLAALQARLAQDGARLEPACRFVDEGYSGATLVRPGLERLRDLVATGTLDRVYVYAPDRLARRYAYQVLLLDEFRRGGAEVVFLNRPIGVSPEDDLLLQVQGMVAEYERAQILERSRRGKRHAARRGAVSVLSTFQLPTGGPCDGRTELDVHEAGPSAPHHGVAGRRIGGTGEVATEPGDLGQIARERWRRVVACAAGHPVEQAHFAFGQGKPGRGIRGGAVEHGQPEQSPAQDTE